MRNEVRDSSSLHLHSSIFNLLSFIFFPPSSLLRPQSFSRPAPRRKRIASPVRNSARAGLTSPPSVLSFRV